MKNKITAMFRLHGKRPCQIWSTSSNSNTQVEASVLLDITWMGDCLETRDPAGMGEDIDASDSK